MVRLKAVYFITDEGFNIYTQSFGSTEQDQDMVSSLIQALRTFSKEVIAEADLQTLGFGGGGDGDAEGARMLLEQGGKVSAVVLVVLDKDNAEREEYTLRKQMMSIIRRVEETFADALSEAIFQKSKFLGLETLVNSYFFRDKMSRIYQNEFSSLNDYIKFPQSLLFELTPKGIKTYPFYRDFQQASVILKQTKIEEIDDLIDFLESKSSMISFQDCIERFGQDKLGEIFSYLKLMTKKGVFDAYNFERLTSIES
ncbi:MAG: hypothetical protein ACXACP_13545 [Candidatus Hodarchaeales archaeon]|jgi:hypothetical protein